VNFSIDRTDSAGFQLAPKIIHHFFPSSTEQEELTKILPDNSNLVENFGILEKAGPFISKVKTKE
jgi:hypothetical protein